jgi:transcriptional regulator with XRE-family HTH domain
LIPVAKKRQAQSSPVAPAAEPEAIARVLCARVRELRKQKRWTLSQMSAASGVSRSMLNDIERGRANPTLVVAHRIAQALGMSLGDLIEMLDTTRRIEIIHADDHTYQFRSDRRCRIRTLSPLALQKDVEFYEIVLGPGGALRRSPHYHGTRELLAVRQGKVRLCVAEETAELAGGDSVYYPGDVDHSLENLGEEEAVLYQVVTYVRE